MAVVRAAVMIFITVAFIFLVVIAAAVVIAAGDADVLCCSGYHCYYFLCSSYLNQSFLIISNYGIFYGNGYSFAPLYNHQNLNSYYYQYLRYKCVKYILTI